MPGAGLPGLMAGYLFKTTAVLIVALLAAAAAKRRPAAVRHFILSSALIGLILLPLLTFVPIGWRSPLLPAWMAVSAPHLAEAPRAEGPARASEAGRSVWLQVRGQGDAARSAAGRPGEGISVSPASPAAERPALEKSPVPAPLSNASPIEPQGRPGLPALPGLLLAVLWPAGLAVILLRLAFGLAGASRLTAEGTPLDDASWRVLLERFIAFVSLRREVRLKSHPAVVVPLTWGFRRPIVLFPEEAGAWTDDERSSALYHELSHIKRADFLAMLLVRTSLALFWWNPLCWIVYREILKEQEIACDELVLRAGIRPSTYAASLLAFRRSAGFRWSPSAALLGMVGRSSFEGRLAAILKQKLTLMEVKMKTKIMLALTLVLALALIGTARPVSGTGTSGRTTVLAETALPSPASVDIAFEAIPVDQTQAEKAVVQETGQEKAQAAEKAKQAEKAKEAEKAAKEKAEVAKTIVIKSDGGEGQPIEVVIMEGDQVKKLVLERPLTITKGKDGDTLVLSVDGKDIEFLKGEPLRLEIKGGELEVIREGQPLKVHEGEGKTVYIVTPGGKSVAEGKTFRIAKEVETGKDGVKVVVETRKEGEPAMAWTFKEKVKGEGVWVAKELPGKPDTMTWVGKGGRALAFSPALDEKVLVSVHAMQEQLKAIKAKKLDLSALEESLKKLEFELQAKEEKLKALELKLEKTPGEFTVVKRSGGDEAKSYSWVMENSKAVKDAKGAKTVIGIGEKEGEISLLFTGYDGEAGKAAFERAIARLKQDLPEGYKLAEQKYDAENGAMTFKIATPEGKKTDEKLVKKIVDSVNEAVKAAK